MKILLIGPGKLKYMPYARFYLDSIDRVKNEVHLAYWNRDERPEDTSLYAGIVLHEFRLFMLNNAPLREKVSGFFKYRLFCKRLFRKGSFDLVILLHSLSGLMVYDILYRKYRNHFILDYRDSTYESKSRLFKKAVGDLVKWSTVTFVSSDAFRVFLPQSMSEKIITSHNLIEDSLKHRSYIKTKSPKIRLAFWGFIRHYDVNCSLIEKIANDSRFELHYYGREQKDALDIKEYAHRIGAQNVFFHGEYIPEQRYDFVTSTDVIHNIYNGANENLAMGNKYYDSLIFHIPQICQIGSYMGEMCECNYVGLAIDASDPFFCDKVYEYYSSLNWDRFYSSCDKELNRVYSEFKRGEEIIHSITTD